MRKGVAKCAKLPRSGQLCFMQVLLASIVDFLGIGFMNVQRIPIQVCVWEQHTLLPAMFAFLHADN